MSFHFTICSGPSTGDIAAETMDELTEKVLAIPASSFGCSTIDDVYMIFNRHGISTSMSNDKTE